MTPKIAILSNLFKKPKYAALMPFLISLLNNFIIGRIAEPTVT